MQIDWNQNKFKLLPQNKWLTVPTDIWKIIFRHVYDFERCWNFDAFSFLKKLQMVCLRFSKILTPNFAYELMLPKNINMHYIEREYVEKRVFIFNVDIYPIISKRHIEKKSNIKQCKNVKKISQPLEDISISISKKYPKKLRKNLRNSARNRKKKKPWASGKLFYELCFYCNEEICACVLEDFYDFESLCNYESYDYDSDSECYDFGNYDYAIY
jgi:hypothetical protein